MYCLNRVLFSKCEAVSTSFTKFLQASRTQFELLPQADPTRLHPDSLSTSAPRRESWRKVPLQRKQTVKDILYTSALPQMLFSKIAPEDTWNFLEFSECLTKQLRKRGFELTNCEPDHRGEDIALRWLLWNEFVIETQRPGWITFRLSEAGLDLWLKRCINCNDEGNLLSHYSKAESPIVDDILEPKPVQGELISDELTWQMQYTYTQCCRLLRLWEQVHFYTDGSLVADSTMFPDGASLWLAADQSQMQIVQQLIAIIDDMAEALFWIPYRLPSKQYFLLLKRASQLCQSFDLFCRTCLSGFPQHTTSPLAGATADIPNEYHARFYLVAVIKDVLKALLHQYFNLEAPASL